MSQSGYVWIYIGLAVVAANLPWLSDRLFFVSRSDKGKSAWFRVLEWAALYFLMGAIGMGLERRLTGEVYSQSWVFYVVTLALFVVFALPGFVYCYDLRYLLRTRRKSTRSRSSH